MLPVRILSLSLLRTRLQIVLCNCLPLIEAGGWPLDLLPNFLICSTLVLIFILLVEQFALLRRFLLAPIILFHMELLWHVLLLSGRSWRWHLLIVLLDVRKDSYAKRLNYGLWLVVFFAELLSKFKRI